MKIRIKKIRNFIFGSLYRRWFSDGQVYLSIQHYAVADILKSLQGRKQLMAKKTYKYGQVGHIADDTCNVRVQEYDAFAMAGLFLLICLVRLVGFGNIVFAIGCVTLN